MLQMIGRPWLYALGSSGGAGVTQMLELMRCGSSRLRISVEMTAFVAGRSLCAPWEWQVSPTCLISVLLSFQPTVY